MFASLTSNFKKRFVEKSLKKGSPFYKKAAFVFGN
jgi:hypothetical protein